MHKFTSQKRAQITRFVTMENLETGTVDCCFDDSDVFNREGRDFSFMEEGESYDCKILLFGDSKPDPKGVAKKVLCRVLRENVSVGNRQRVEVSVEKSIYYVPRSQVEDQLKNGFFYYYYTRKDLFQVDDVVHPAYSLAL